MSQLTSSQLVVASATAIQIALQLIDSDNTDQAVSVLDKQLEYLTDYLGRDNRLGGRR